jgi:hypothetical protein
MDYNNDGAATIVSIPSKLVKILNSEIQTLNKEIDPEMRFMRSEIIESLITSLSTIVSTDGLEEKITQWRL